MLVDLVQVSTSDGVRLHGALEPVSELGARQRTADLAVDVWLCLHGTGSNFYSASTLAGLAPKLVEGGAAVLRANTRGHDLVCTGPSAMGRSWQGAAFERIDEAPLDIAAWVALLRERGFERIGLLGHSLGAIKAIYTLATADAPPIAALAAISPPHLSYAYFCASRRGAEFQQLFAVAQTHLDAGRGEELLFAKFPISYYVSAASYVDRYGPAERYNVLRLLGQVKCPTLVTYGSSEVQAEVAFQGMPEAVEKLATKDNCLQAAVIAGADHIYTGCHDVLAGRIASWLVRLERKASSNA
jgi:pimeloyl-ACP methyl ester carboxylesterase